MKIKRFTRQRRNDRMHYVGCVSTYKDLREDTDYVIEIFDTAIRELTKDEMKPRFFSLSFINGNLKDSKFNQKNHERVNELLIKNQLKALCLHFSEQEYRSDSVVSNDTIVQVIICDKQLSEEISKFRYYKNDVSFSISAKHYSEKLEFLKQWIREIFVNVDGINGYMDYLPIVYLAGCVQATAYENVSNRNANLFGDFCNKARGYFWLTILTHMHIDNLGGNKYVKDNIPNYHIDEVKMNDGSTTYFCQLTDDIFGFDKQKYSQLKEFLKPILDEEDMREESLARYEDKSIEERKLVFSKQQYVELKEYNKIDLTELIKQGNRSDNLICRKD